MTEPQPEYQEAPVHFLGARLLSLGRRWSRLERRTPPTCVAERADDELFAVFFATIAFMSVTGAATLLLLPPGTAFELSFVVICGLAGFLLGVGIPLQLCTWGLLDRPETRFWQWGIEILTAAVCVALAAVIQFG